MKVVDSSLWKRITIKDNKYTNMKIDPHDMSIPEIEKEINQLEPLYNEIVKRGPQTEEEGKIFERYTDLWFELLAFDF